VIAREASRSHASKLADAARKHGVNGPLVQRHGETFNDVVRHLDHAVDMAMKYDAPTDEINKR
jgi:hypothetical protein